MNSENLKSAQEKMSELEGQMDEQMKKYRKTLEETEKNLSESAQQLRTMIKQHPLAAISIALVVGYFVGRCFTSKK